MRPLQQLEDCEYKMTKILISPGYGAGWATWAEYDKQKKVAEYEPIIDYLESGGDPKLLNTVSTKKELIYHPLVKQMMVDLELDYFYAGGADQLEVTDVSGNYRIDEYDGNEYIVTEVDFW